MDPPARSPPLPNELGSPVLLLRRAPGDAATAEATSRSEGGIEERNSVGVSTISSQSSLAVPLSPTDPAAFFDDALVDAFTRSAKDRVMLMKADLEMERFLNDPSQIRLPIQPPFFAPANTFQRLLIHRLADSFGLTRILDASTPLSPTMTSGLPSQGMTGTLILVKTPQSRVPPVRITELKSLIVPSIEPRSPSIVQSEAGETSLPTPSIFRIMARTPASEPTRPRSSASAEDASRRAMTLEEREAAYAEARQRIFAASAEDEVAAKEEGEMLTSATTTTSCPQTPLLRPHALRPSAPSFDPLNGFMALREGSAAPAASTSMSSPGEEIIAPLAQSLEPSPMVASTSNGSLPAVFDGRRRSGSRSPSSASISTVASSKTSTSTSSSLSDSRSRTSRSTSSRISAAQAVMRFGPSPGGTPLFPPSHPQRPSSPSPSTASISTTSSRSARTSSSIQLGPGLPDLEPMGRRNKGRRLARKRTPPPEPAQPLHPSLPIKPAWINNKHRAASSTSGRSDGSASPSVASEPPAPIVEQQSSSLATTPVYAMPHPQPMMVPYPPGQAPLPFYPMPPMAYYPIPFDRQQPGPTVSTTTTTTTTTSLPTWDPMVLAAIQQQQHMDAMMQQMRLQADTNGVAAPLQLDEDAPRAARPPSMALFDPSGGPQQPAGGTIRRATSGAGRGRGL